MNTTGWRAAKRLGVRSLSCVICKGRFLLNLTKEARTIDGRIGVGHWRVEQRLRSAGFGSWTRIVWPACSQYCAKTIAAQKTAEYGRYRLPKIRFSVHGPYTESEL
jgi:hypothetical protein